MTDDTRMRAAGRDAGGNLDQAEVDRFAELAEKWWDPEGEFRPLHQLAPARLEFVRDEIAGHFGRTSPGLRVLKGLRVLDIGCGGGLVSEPLARLGATVTGIDPAAENVAAARRHAEPQGLAIDYRAVTAEELVAEAAAFDAVVALEVIEHVPHPADFVATAAALVRPGGVLILSTINRTAASYALAIVGAEVVLRWLPRGTHDWNRFVTPDELAGHVEAAGLVPGRTRGLAYDVLGGAWTLTDKLAVNYLMAAQRP